MKTDILIIGGGSAGFGAAYAASKFGDVNVTLIEKNDVLGGTSTVGGVNCWEPGIGGNGIHKYIADELLRLNKAGIGKYMGDVNNQRPYSFSEIHQCEKYENTLFRAVPDFSTIRRFHFEPTAMQDIMLELLKQNKVNVCFNTAFTGVEMKNRVISRILTDKGEFEAEIVIDCTGEIEVARAAGCSYRLGEDSVEEFGELCAPADKSDTLNGATLVFRVTPTEDAYIDEIPEEYSGIDVDEWFENKVKAHRVFSQCNQYPNGDLNVNMLPTMEGLEFHKLGEAKAIPIMKARIYRYLNWLQREKNFKYKMKYIFPMVGIREGYRLDGQYVLTENDIRKGYPLQDKSDEVIAFGDHDLDTHGSTNVKNISPRLEKAYGIPYSCLLPKEVNNLLVACRGISLSHIALSSCRLSRTILAIGEAAGVAAAISVRDSIFPTNVSKAELREKLNIH